MFNVCHFHYNEHQKIIEHKNFCFKPGFEPAWTAAVQITYYMEQNFDREHIDEYD